MALVSFQVNFIRAGHRDSKNQIENTIFTTTIYNRENVLLQHSITENMSYCNILLQSKHYW